VHWCLKAAEILDKQYGISAEVVDLYSLSPLDRAGIRKSVSKTTAPSSLKRMKRVGVGSEVIAIINEECFFELDAAPGARPFGAGAATLQPHAGKKRRSRITRMW